MIEKIVRDYLENTIQVDTYLEMQGDGSTFIILEKTGSSKENQICQATIAVQSYAPSLYEASLLNERVKAAMENIVILDSVSACSLNSDYNYTDPDTKRYRYQAVFDLTHY